jgi:dienelactone hydrolase
MPRAARAFTLALSLALACAYALPSAQSASKKPLTIDDYTKWRSIGDAAISGDGKWVTYVLRTANVPDEKANAVLHILNLETNEDVAVQHGTSGIFSPDSKWIVYSVDPAGGARGGRGARGAQGAQAAQGARGATPPLPPQRAELRNLATGSLQSWQDIQSAVFSPSSSHLVLKRKPPTPPAAANGGRGGSGSDAPPQSGGGGVDAQQRSRGTEVVLVDLKTGRWQTLASVGDIVFTKKGDLLAYATDGAQKDGNGLFVFDTHSGRTTPLDNDARIYSRVAWSDDGRAVAALKGIEVEKKRERQNVLMVFQDVPAAIGADDIVPKPIVFDPASTDAFPKDWVVSDRSPLTISDDDKRVFFGMKEQTPAPPQGEKKTPDEAANVDVWNSRDERIQSVQMIRADQDRNFAFREAFDASTGKFVKLADETMRDLDVTQDGRWAIGRDARGFVSDYKRAAADIYRVNTSTGERTLIVKGQLTNTSTGNHTFGISPDGRQFVYWRDGRFQAYVFDAGTTTPLGGTPLVSFVDVEFDHPGPKPPFGVAGFTRDGKGLIAEQRYDLWLVPLDGSAARNLTNGFGAKNEIRLRYVKLDPPDPATAPVGLAAPSGPFGGGVPGGGRGGATRDTSIDLSKPLLLSAYGQWTKKAGFYELANDHLKELVYDDAAFTNPSKAAHADKFLFTRQTFVEFPDLRVSGRDLAASKRISQANPQQSEFVWGHRILFDFKDHDGHRLQGLLTIPDDYKPGEKRPMLVNFYEKNSQNLHRYNAPSYLTGMGSSPMQAVSDGYITMVPDVYFHTGSSHSDMLEAVEAAVKKVIDMGYVDPKRIGINGHSYGGEGAAFIGTRSRLFAAVGVGAGVSDLYQDFNQNWGWSYQVTGGSGANGDDYYLYGQGRWGFSPWDKPEVYMFESALTHVPEATAPFLIMHGTADPTVAFQNGLGLYNALRYNNKNAVLLAYPGEGHGLRGMANRRDLTIRYFEFFDHYLRGAPAPKWLSEGIPFLKKDLNGDTAAEPPR